MSQNICTEDCLKLNSCVCIDADQLEAIKRAGYLLEFRPFYEQEPFAGWQRCYGEVIENADTLYPKAWAALQSERHAWKVKTEAEWQAMSDAEPWSGVGGVPYFVQDLEARTLRLPDLRGMYAEASGFDGLEVGGVHGDAIRNISGSLHYTASTDQGGTWLYCSASGAFSTRQAQNKQDIERCRGRCRISLNL